MFVFKKLYKRKGSQSTAGGDKSYMCEEIEVVIGNLVLLENTYGMERVSKNRKMHKTHRIVTKLFFFCIKSFIRRCNKSTAVSEKLEMHD